MNKFFRKKTKLAIGAIGGVIAVFLIFLAFRASGADGFYFGSVVNNDPTEVGNYFTDAGLTTPANEVPDSTQVSVTVVLGATFDGNITFLGTATNEGIVTGDAIFMEDSQNNGVVDGTGTFNGHSRNNGSVQTGVFQETSSNNSVVAGNAEFYTESLNDASVDGDAIFYGANTLNQGTVQGVKTRYFTGDASVSLDFVATGPWTVVADGCTVGVEDATYDNTTTFSAINGGRFSDRTFYSGYFSNQILTLIFSGNLDETSVPVASDFEVTVGGTPLSISSVDVQDNKVILAIAENIDENDSLVFTYTPGSNEIQSNGPQNLPVAPIVSATIKYVIPVGTFPYGSTVVGTKVYITNEGGDTVSVIDSTTNTVIATIAVGDDPNFSSNVAGKVYVPNTVSDTVSVISSVTDTVIATIPVGDGPFYTSAVGNKIFVANNNTNTVSVIDSTTDTVVATLTVGTGPYTFATVGGKVYVCNYLDDTISVIDVATLTVTGTLPSGDGPRYSTVLGSKAYFGNNSDNKVTVVDSLTDTATNVTVGNQPFGLLAVGNKVYVSNTGSQTVSVLSYDTNSVIETIHTSSGNPYYLTSVGNLLFVDNNNVSIIDVVDTTIGAIVSSRITDTSPYHFAVVGRKVFTSNTIAANVSVLKVDTLSHNLPNLISFTSSTSSGTYTTGQDINITANFGKTLASGSTMTVVLNTGDSVVLNNRSGMTLFGTYTVGSGDSTPDLAVSSIASASVTDGTNSKTDYEMPSSQGSLVAENSFITRNIGDTKDIVIGSFDSIDVGNNPYQISTPITVDDVEYIYVANQGDDTVSVIRLSDHAVVDTIDVGSEPYGLAQVSVSGTTYVYVANIGSQNVSVINTETNAVVATVTAGVKPYYVAAVGAKVYVTNGSSNTVTVINANNNTVTETISVGVYPRGIKAHGTDLYVANYGDPTYPGGNYISVIDSTTDEVTDNILLPAGTIGPRGVTTLGDYVYVTGYLSHDVTVIDTNDNSVVDTIEVGKGPRGIVGLSGKIYVENFDDSTISVIDTADNTVESTIAVGNAPSGMAVDGTDIYVSSFQDNTISIFNTTNNSLRAPVSAPTLTVSTASSIETTSATLNGEITDTGGEDATVRGFHYGTTTSYGSTSSTSGTYGAAPFTATLTGLTCATTYHFRSFATNTAGTGTSTDSTFSTSACASSGGGGGGGGGGGWVYVPTSPAATPNPDPVQPTPVPVTPTENTPIKNPPTSSTKTLIATKGNLSVGAKGQAIFELQKYLNANGFIVSKTGPGSPGKETTLFGKATKAALIKFQEAHAKEILAPTGLKKGTGTFGPATKKYIEAHQ